MENIECFKQIVELQDSFNSKLNQNWKTANYDWASYLMVESAEQLDSLDIYHWKNKKNDLDNFKVEVIDNLHFLTSLWQTISDNEGVATLFNTKFAKVSKMEQDEKDTLVTLTKYFTLKVLEFDFTRHSAHLATATETLFKLMIKLDINSPQKVYQEYLVKNALNIFRKNKGYKEGTYIKTWGVDESENSIEDNVIAYTLSDFLLEGNELSMESLLEELEFYYESNVRNQKPISE